MVRSSIVWSAGKYILVLKVHDLKKVWEALGLGQLLVKLIPERCIAKSGAPSWTPIYCPVSDWFPRNHCHLKNEEIVKARTFFSVNKMIIFIYKNKQNLVVYVSAMKNYSNAANNNFKVKLKYIFCKTIDNVITMTCFRLKTERERG